MLNNICSGYILCSCYIPSHKQLHTHIQIYLQTQDLSIQTANAVGSTIILATDPDADRLALAEKDLTSGSWKIFTGNETGALMGWWAFKNYKERNPNFDGMQGTFKTISLCFPRPYNS